MKTQEDEAWEEMERRQGAGGFPAKRAMAADKLHWSDCAVHNGPAYPAGECDCGVAQEPVACVQDLDEVKRKHLVYEKGMDWKDPLYTTPPKRERVLFPTMLRKMWSGGEVQAWLDENVNKEKNNGT
jgi:hypothetical protein